jgi:ABC-type polysaccharide/polyol phosphate export permease
MVKVSPEPGSFATPAPFSSTASISVRIPATEGKSGPAPLSLTEVPLAARKEMQVRATTPPQEWTENRPSTGFRPPDLGELWAYRELGVFLALRDLKVRYKQAVFGAGWAVLQPLAAAAVFTVVFRRLANMPSDGLPYPLFAYVGVSVWTYFSGAVTKATQTLVQNSALVSKVYFPRLIAPAAAVLPGLLDLLVSLAFLLALVPLYHVSAGWTVLTTPLWILPLVAGALGVGLWLGTLNVRYRDVDHGVALLLQLWLFVSPVVYPSSELPESWRLVYFLNPAAGSIESFRWALLGAPWPGAGVYVSLATSAAVLVGGVLYFLRMERRFADVI